MLLALLIPVYNEERTLAQSVQRVLATPLPPGITARKLIIVNDGSSDGTAAILDTLRRNHTEVHAVLHPRNQGKGAAVRTALTAGLELNADIFLIHDADLEYDPADHSRVLLPILDGRADAVIGSRFLGDTHRVLYFWHSVANRVITTVSNVFTNLNLTDIECCTKGFTREVASRLTLVEDRFGIEPELIARIARVEVGPTRSLPRIYEVAVTYAGRTYAEGKKITWKDGVSALWCILKHNSTG